MDDAFLKRVKEVVLLPTLDGLRKEGIPFCGVIYMSLMIKPDGSISVLEYNAGLGDPETQVVLPVFGGDFGETILACCKVILIKSDGPHRTVSHWEWSWLREDTPTNIRLDYT